MQKAKEINLQEVFYAMLNRIWLIVLCAAFLAVLVYAYSANFITPRYRASVTLYVNNNVNNNSDGESGYSEISSSDLATSQRLVDTYIAILQQYDVMDEVSKKVEQQTGKRPNPESIMSNMTAEAINETEVFTITVSHTNPKMAMVIAQAIGEVAPEQIEKIVKGSDAEVVNKAREPKNPYTPNNLRNAIYGAIIGAVLAIVYLVVWVMTDVRINGEEDLAMLSDAPVLGVIPNFDSDEKSSYSYKRYGYASKRDYTSNKEAN